MSSKRHPPEKDLEAKERWSSSTTRKDRSWRRPTSP